MKADSAAVVGLDLVGSTPSYCAPIRNSQVFSPFYHATSSSKKSQARACRIILSGGRARFMTEAHVRISRCWNRVRCWEFVNGMQWITSTIGGTVEKEGGANMARAQVGIGFEQANGGIRPVYWGSHRVRVWKQPTGEPRSNASGRISTIGEPRNAIAAVDKSARKIYALVHPEGSTPSKERSY